MAWNVPKDKLTELAEKYGSDKTPKFRHSYTSYYDYLLNPKKDTLKRVLEIGVGTVENMSKIVSNYSPGASLRMWRDYFPNAEIYGIDNDENTVRQVIEDRIRTFKVDQSEPVELTNFIEVNGRDFDLIIDDGSHNVNHQIISFINLYQYLKKGGIYIIEDVNEPEKLKENLYFVDLEIHNFNKDIFDDRLAVYKND